MIQTRRSLTMLILSLLLFPLSGLGEKMTTGPILVLGDSLSAGYGIAPEEGWVALLDQRLDQQALEIDVVNASISGETTAGGLSRLPKLLAKYQPSVVIIELGGNDGLRGYPISAMRKRLIETIELSREQQAKVLLLGMQIPPNYVSRYSTLFAESYLLIADQKDALSVPFFLEGIATQPALMQKDGIHPTAEGQPQMLDNVWPSLQTLLEEVNTDTALSQSPSTSSALAN